MSTDVSMSAFRTSGIILSVPGVFPLFICLIATLTSARAGGSKFILGSGWTFLSLIFSSSSLCFLFLFSI
jgi:hypothetical protein